MVFKIQPQANAGTSNKWGANDSNKLNKFLSDIDLISIDATDAPILNTLTKVRSGKLAILNNNYPTTNFYGTIVSSILTANRQYILPLITSNQEFLMMDHDQIPTNKTWNLNTNIFNDTGATQGGIPSHNGIQYRNKPMGSALQVPQVNASGSDWSWTTISGVSGFNLTDQNLVDTSIATGDLIKSNGTKFVRFGMGTALQFLRVNAGATDLEWAAVSAGGAHKANHVAGGSDAFVSSDILDAIARYLERIADPTSAAGRIWINATDLKYWDNTGTPVKQTVERQANKGIASGYCDLDSSTLVPLSRLSGIVDANIGSHTTTKITTSSKSLLNSNIVYIDQANSFENFKT